jgi:hypothetical protein
MCSAWSRKAPPVAAAKTLTPEQRTQRARIAALTRWAGEDRRAVSRQHLFARYVREAVEADPSIDHAEAARRAEIAVRAHMTRLAFASSRARAARKASSGERPA